MVATARAVAGRAKLKTKRRVAKAHTPLETTRSTAAGQDDDEGFLGIPKPPSNAASGCFDCGFCGAGAGFSSAFIADGDGSYGFRKKSSTGGAGR